MTQQPGQPPEPPEYPAPQEGGGNHAATHKPDMRPDTDEQSTVHVIRLLVAQGQEYASTEMQRQKLRVRILGLAARDALIFGLVVIFLLMGLLIALLVGGIWALAPHVGPIWALLIVLGACLAVIAGLLLFIRARVKSAINQTFYRDGRK